MFVGIACPACTPESPEDNDLLFLFADGNFSAKHYNRTNTEGEKLFANYFIDIPNEESDLMDIRSVGECCANHIAGKDRTGDARCDINGIFGSVCPHGIPFTFSNIGKGETYNLPRAVIKSFNNMYPNASLIFAYDVICRLEKNLVKALIFLVLRLLIFL